MATYYRAIVSGRARKQFTCPACGCIYQAAIERTAVATGGLQAIARARAVQQLQERLKTGADLRPCPTCGLIAPAVFARRTEYVHGLVWLGAAVVAAIVAGVGGAGVISLEWTIGGVCGVVVLAVLLHAMIAAGNPNRRRSANMDRAEADVAAGLVDVIHPGQPGDGKEPRSWTMRHTLGIALAAVAPLVLILPAYMRTTMDLPLNRSLRPQVVAIGTPFTVTMPPPTFQSVEGRWSETPNVEVLNAAALHCPATLPATSRAAPLGEKISVAQGQTNFAPTDLFCTLTVPNDPGLDGQTLHLRATLNVVYPVRTSTINFEPKVTTVTNDFTVELAPKADFDTFNLASCGAIGVAVIGTFAGGGLLAWGIAAIKKQGVPAESVAMEAGVTR